MCFGREVAFEDVALEERSRQGLVDLVRSLSLRSWPAAAAPGLRVLLHAELPSLAKRARKGLLTGRGKANVRRAHASPAAGDRHEGLVGRLGDERRLDLRSEHQIAVALGLVGERREDPAADAEVRLAHVRLLFRPVEAERKPAEVTGGTRNRPGEVLRNG